ASSGGEVVVRLWDVATGREVNPPAGHRSAVRNLVVSPADGTIFTGGADGTIRRWDATGRELGRLGEHPGGVGCLVMSADGRALYSGGYDPAICRWELPGGRLVWSRTDGGGIGPHYLALSPDGRTLAKEWTLLDAATGRRRAYLKSMSEYPLSSGG